MNYLSYQNSRTRNLTLFLSWLWIYSCAQAQTTNPYLEDLKEKFITHFTAGVKAYVIEEIVDKNDDKKAFLRKTLKGKYLPGKETVTYKELFIRNMDLTESWHLGAITLDFSNEQQADQLYSKIKTTLEPAYFNFTIIVMRYAVLKRGATIIVVYSESGDAPKMTSFFSTLTSPK